MRNSKKRWLLGLSCAALICGFAGCKSDEGKNSPSEYSYDWTYVQEFVDECDADMTIDGVLDEARWQDLNWLYHGEAGVKLSYTTMFSEKGLYIAAKAEDEKMQWNARFNFSHLAGSKALNSSFWFQIAGPDVVDGHAMRQFNFFVDPFNRASRNQTRFAAKCTTNGDILKGEANEMVAEMFVSWDALNIELGENGELPEFVYFTPSYRYIAENDSSCVDNRWIFPTGTYPENLLYWNYDKGYQATLGDFNWYRAKTGVHFNEEGYVNYDAEGAILGMAANGICKSDGWDVSKLMTDGEVTCVAPYEQYIFVKDVYAEKFHLKTDLIFNDYTDGNLRNEWPSMGLAVVQANNNSRCFYISGDTVLSGKQNSDGTWGTFCNSIELVNWTKSSFGSVSAPLGKDVPNEGFTLELVKDGSVIYYIVEGQLVGTDNIPQLSGKACPALFSIGGRGTYKNIEVDTDSDSIDRYLDKIVRTVTTSVKGSGLVEPDTYAVKMIDGVAAQDLTVSIAPDTNYVVSDISLSGLEMNESEYWSYFLENYSDGVLTIDKELIKGHLTIEVTFTRFRAQLSADQVVEVSGKLKDENGDALVGSNMVVCDEDYGPLYYSITTSSTGQYSLLLLKAGEYEMEGHKFTTDGVYRVRVLGSGGFKSIYAEVDVNEGVDGVLKRDFILEPLEFRPTVRLEGTAFATNLEYTMEGAYKVQGAYYYENKSVEQNESFVTYATIDPSLSSGIASEVGFLIGTGDGNDGHYLLFALKHTSSGYSVYVWTEGGNEIKYNSTGLSFKSADRWMSTNPYGLNGDSRLEMSLVYKNGQYLMYFNGCLAFTLNETELMKDGYPQDTYKNVIGTEGNKKIGLVSLNKQTAFFDWGFSTDTTVIQNYIDAEDRPVIIPEPEVDPTPSMSKPDLPTWYYGGGSTSIEDGTLNLQGAYLYGGKGIKTGTEFVAEATFTIGSGTTEIGFVVTAESEKNPMFVYKPGNNVFMFFTGDWEKDVENIPNQAAAKVAGEQVTMTLLYKGGVYYIFFDGTLACQISETQKATYSDFTVKEVIGTGKMTAFGLASLNGSGSTYTDWGYTTDESKFPSLEADSTPSMSKPDLPTHYYGDGFTSIEDGTLNLKGAYLYGGNGIKTGTEFVAEATFTIGSGTTEIGFVVTAESEKNPMFVYKPGNNVFMFFTGDWEKDVENIPNQAAAKVAGEQVTMTLLYKGGVYYIFFDGTLACQISETQKATYSDYTVKEVIGTGKMTAFGLASLCGSSTYTDWGYTTDAAEVAKWVTEA